MGKIDLIIKLYKDVINPSLKLGLCGIGAYGVYKLADKALDKGYKIGVGGSYDLNTKTISANAALDLLNGHTEDGDDDNAPSNELPSGS